MIFIAIRAARDAFAIICVECGAGECGASFHAVIYSSSSALALLIWITLEELLQATLEL